jgi:rRNA-processing protein FCF1
VLIREVNAVTELVQEQLRVSRQLEECVQESFYFRVSRVIGDEIERRLHSDLKC